MANTKLSQTMKSAMLNAGEHRTGYAGGIPTNTLGALMARGLVNLAPTSQIREIGTHVVSVAGWDWLKAEYGIERPADEGRMTLEEALADVTWIGDLAISENEYAACLASWAQHGNTFSQLSLETNDYATAAFTRGDLKVSVSGRYQAIPRCTKTYATSTGSTERCGADALPGGLECEYHQGDAAAMNDSTASFQKGTRVTTTGAGYEGRTGTVNGVDAGEVTFPGHKNFGRRYIGVTWDEIDGDMGCNRRSRPFVDTLTVIERPAVEQALLVAELMDAAKYGHQGHMAYAEAPIVDKLMSEGLVTRGHNLDGFGDTAITIKGWKLLHTVHGIERPADEGRLTLSEALEVAYTPAGNPALPGFMPDVNTFVGTVVSVGATVIVADFPDFPKPSGHRMRVQVRYGHAIRVGDEIEVDRRGWFVRWVPATEDRLTLSEALDAAYTPAGQVTCKHLRGLADTCDECSDRPTTVFSDDGQPMTYLGVRVPSDLSEDWYGPQATGWRRGIYSARNSG